MLRFQVPSIFVRNQPVLHPISQSPILVKEWCRHFLSTISRHVLSGETILRSLPYAPVWFCISFASPNSRRSGYPNRQAWRGSSVLTKQGHVRWQGIRRCYSYHRRDRSERFPAPSTARQFRSKPEGKRFSRDWFAVSLWGCR